VLLRINATAGNLPTNYIAVTYNTAAGGSVTVATNAGTAGSIPVSFANGDTLTARTDATGTTVFVYKNGTYVGGVNVPTGPGAWTPAAAGGRVGIVLANNARADNFSGANLP
jgi:hypothetical protein